jgi:hypothetical protein
MLTQNIQIIYVCNAGKQSDVFLLSTLHIYKLLKYISPKNAMINNDINLNLYIYILLRIDKNKREAFNNIGIFKLL